MSENTKKNTENTAKPSLLSDSPAEPQTPADGMSRKDLDYIADRIYQKQQEAMRKHSAIQAAGPAKGTTPEGERNVVRKEPAKHPEWYEVEVEKLPSDFSMPDRVQQMLDDKTMGWEIVGSKDAVRVRLRCPYKNYLAAVERGYSQADSRRRRKIEDAVVDVSERQVVDLRGLEAGVDVDAAHAVAKGR